VLRPVLLTQREHNMTADHRATGLGESKLRGSGLSLDDAKLLKMSCLSGPQTAKLNPSFKSLCSLRINYHSIDGSPLSDWPQGEPFYRIRYLEVPTDFSGLSSKPQRYTQPPNTAPVAYFPQIFPEWSALVPDPDQPLIITEGELKAAKACKDGFPTIGLGGVYNWRSNKLGITWIDSLDYVVWLRRHVYLCFDSDYKTNPLVCHALKDFANELTRRGAFVHVVALPQLPGLDKVGLDDFLVHAGPSSDEMFRELLTNAEPLGLTKPLWNMNEKYVYVRRPGFIVDLKDLDLKVSPSAFKEHLQSAHQYQERQLRKDGSISFKTVSAAAAWLKWPLRQEVSRLTYEPGAKLFYKGMLNAWPGWGCEPKSGEVAPFLDLIDHLFTNAEPESKDWFLKWCAYPLKYPGVKMFSSVVMHGVRHGTGKSLIGYTLGKIYGRNFTEISQLDLHNAYNEWAENKQFAMGDDVTGSNKRQDADFLKKLITQQEIRLNPKYIPSYTVPDCINYYFTSNHPDSFFLEDDDRRFFVHEVSVPPLDEEFYVEYDLWLGSGGAEAVFDYLLKLRMLDFNPAAPAYKTLAKERMINSGRSDLASWVRQMLTDPDNMLKLGRVVAEQDLFTSKELLNYYDPEGRTGTTANGLGRELSRAGVRQVCDGQPIRLANGTQGRYYIIRNPSHWEKMQPSKVGKELSEIHCNKKAKKY